MKKNITAIINVVLIFFFLFSLGLAWYIGYSSRIYTPFLYKEIAVKQEKEAFFQWLQTKIKGRTVLQFSAHLPVTAINETKIPKLYSRKSKVLKNMLTNDNYLFAAVRLSLVRKIIAVVPEAIWPQLKKKMANSQVYQIHEDQIQGWMDATPIIILTEKNLPSFTEPVLVNIASSFFSHKSTDSGFSKLALKLKQKSIKYDLATIEKND